MIRFTGLQLNKRKNCQTDTEVSPGATLGTVKPGREVYSENCFVGIYISNKAQPQEDFWPVWGVCKLVKAEWGLAPLGRF